MDLARDRDRDRGIDVEAAARSPLELRDLAPEPAEQWRRLLRFVGWSGEDRAAAARTVEPIFRRGPELAAQTYDYLRRFPETAAVLGWQSEVDEAHLEERRRFFTVWLARTLGLDTSDELARYLFEAGKRHAGHGPRRIHTPPEYVTGSIGLMLGAFARYAAEAGLPADAVAGATAAWSKLLLAQLDLMLLGYRVARELERGSLAVHCALYGRLRSIVGAAEVTVAAEPGARLADVLRKLFDYYPEARPEALERVWRSAEPDGAEPPREPRRAGQPEPLWLEVLPTYVPRRGWRVLLNGRDVAHAEGFAAALRAGDEVAVFPPGR